MAELLSASDIMFTPFEPKVQHRFVLQIAGIPAYILKKDSILGRMFLTYMTTIHTLKK